MLVSVSRLSLSYPKRHRGERTRIGVAVGNPLKGLEVVKDKALVDTNRGQQTPARMNGETGHSTGVYLEGCRLAPIVKYLDRSLGRAQDDLAASPNGRRDGLADIERALDVVGPDRVNVHLAIQATDRRIVGLDIER